ncbi:hypothetical protein J31TS4_14140 [Paenibacillus sp. J31TS4]|uniref:sensor domain-containing protein n=1 Tax=Paenibacillus sp. J31TS4 TaxID=2807195 RepID=UPI001B1C5D2C|nr:EAL domain-containing protein [Paenibacillus sp. J31TS4]GIP38134.1 hypothetical protein J31TS4_14140 [Paenibacillus sp. J31TS4]
MNDRHPYTTTLFLIGCSAIVQSVIFLFFNYNWWPIYFIAALMVFDLKPIRMPNGGIYSLGTVGIIYVLFSKGLLAASIPMTLSTFAFFLGIVSPIKEIQWFRVYSTIGMYYVCSVASYLVLKLTAPVPLLIQIVLVTVTFEYTNLLVRAGIYKFTMGNRFFTKELISTVNKMYLPVVLCVLVLYRLLQPKDMMHFVTEMAYTVFLLVTVNGFLSAYVKQIYQVEESTQRYSSLFEHNPDLVLTLDTNCKVLSVNPMLKKTIGYEPEQLLHRNLVDAFSDQIETEEALRNHFAKVMGGAPQQFELKLTDRHGRNKELHVTAGPTIVNNKVVGAYCIAKDVTDSKETERTIHRLAYYDTVTGLPNRSLFTERLTQSVRRAAEEKSKLAVLYLDMDRFKHINDTLGHHVGDELLVLIAERVCAGVAPKATVSRLAGDEFAILYPDLQDEAEGKEAAKSILKSFSTPFFLHRHEIFLTPSLGISIYPEHGDQEEVLLKNADASMYVAKQAGGNTYRLYSPELQEANEERLTILSNLHRALERSEFSLYYQPKLDLSTGQIMGVEALLRWENAELGNVSPAKFIPIAEESRLILPIGEWVLWTACAQNKAWQEMGYPALPVSVNLSSVQFQQDGLLATLQRVLEETGLEARYLEIEITETMLLHNTKQTMKVLEEIKQLGVCISVDDFGVGYSSLSYLSNFPIDYLKIDKSFILDLDKSDKAESIVKAIISLAHNLNLKVIAEGVETERHLRFLEHEGCDGLQGYYVSRPLPAERFETDIWCKKLPEGWTPAPVWTGFSI